MTIEERLALVARIADNFRSPAWFDTLVRELTDDTYDKYEADKDGTLYGNETYGESLIRYHGLGYITDDQIEELWMRAVLAGLHNLAEEQTDA